MSLQMRLRGQARGKGADVIPFLGQHLLQWQEYFNFVIYNNDLCDALSSPLVTSKVAQPGCEHKENAVLCTGSAQRITKFARGAQKPCKSKPKGQRSQARGWAGVGFAPLPQQITQPDPQVTSRNERTTDGYFTDPNRHRNCGFLLYILHLPIPMTRWFVSGRIGLTID